MKKKILIVEDNKDSREILGLFITKIGCQVIKACNCEEAVTYAEAECPDLIFMDLDLPDADGIKTTTPHFSQRDYIEGCKPREYFHLDDPGRSTLLPRRQTGNWTPIAAIRLCTSR